MLILSNIDGYPFSGRLEKADTRYERMYLLLILSLDSR